MVITKTIDGSKIKFELQELRTEKHNDGTIENIDFSIKCKEPKLFYKLFKKREQIENTLTAFVATELSKKHPEYNVIVAGDFSETIASDKIEYSSRANFSRK